MPDKRGKRRIGVAGLSPAWQKILCFEQFRPGQVNRAVSSHRCASGKVINAALAVAALHADCLAVFPAGGLTGQSIVEELRAHGIATQSIPTLAPTRVCTTVISKGDSVITELVENAAPLQSQELADYAAAVSGACESADAFVITGSTPPGTDKNLHASIFRDFKRPLVLDMRGPELLAVLGVQQAVVKINREELGHTVGHSIEDDARLRLAMQHLLGLGASAVIVTQGDLPTLVGLPAEIWALSVPSVNVVNPIGSGDCFTAALAIGLSQGQPLLEAARFGVAAGSENAAHLLPAVLPSESVQALQAQVTVRRW